VGENLGQRAANVYSAGGTTYSTPKYCAPIGDALRVYLVPSHTLPSQVWLPQFSWYMFDFCPTLASNILFSVWPICHKIIVVANFYQSLASYFFITLFVASHTFMASHTLASQNVTRNQTGP
jgi:hypothetical protein